VGAYVTHPAAAAASHETSWWLLSLFAPSSTDTVNWQKGSYCLTNRSGRFETSANWGQPKPVSRMVEEGSVLVSETQPAGIVQDLATEGISHPVYRAALAVAVALPAKVRP
jgi:CRISPR/Cas system CSM-associated protein Csm4 (group 5 of RAMP superfamily)